MLGLNGSRFLVGGVGEMLPFAAGSFDAVFSAYVFRNLDSVELALAEIGRVLRPGGKAGIVDLGRPRRGWQRRLHRFGTTIVLPTVGLLVGAPRAYTYLHRTLDKLPPPEGDVRERASRARGHVAHGIYGLRPRGYPCQTMTPLGDA